MNNIYVMFECNAHKEFSSMRLLGATTDLQDIKDKLYKLEVDGEVEFNGEVFDKHIRWTVYELNSSFEYVYIEEVTDGEFL